MQSRSACETLETSKLLENEEERRGSTVQYSTVQYDVKNVTEKGREGKGREGEGTRLGFLLGLC